MKAKASFPYFPAGWIWLGGLILLLGIGIPTLSRWQPTPQKASQNTTTGRQAASSRAVHDHDHDPEACEAAHEHGSHSHAHDEGNSLDLSPQAMANLGLTAEFLQPVRLETFRRSITVPAIIVERPGRTRIQVSTPMAGVITHVHAVRGEAVEPGTLLFKLRITAEELVATQTALLTTIGELDVEKREIARLEEVTRSGAVAQKALLERQYAKDKLDVLLAAQQEALRLQGLSDRQIQGIIVNRQLLRDLQIRAPAADQHGEHDWELTNSHQPQPPSRHTASPAAAINEASDHQSRAPASHPLILQDVLVSKGKQVQAGSTLAVLSDLSELYLEGQAFEQDSQLLATAMLNHWKSTAVFGLADQQSEEVSGLEILYAASEVDVRSRTLPFYVRLPNSIVRDIPSPNGLRFIEWKYRPGQRLQLRIPAEEWHQQIVLPVDAVAQEGAETFVFQQNGSHFDRIAVHVIYRDQSYAVIKNDGSIFPGDVVARRGAHQLQMAIKNKSGGGVDPHAGHNH